VSMSVSVSVSASPSATPTAGSDLSTTKDSSEASHPASKSSHADHLIDFPPSNVGSLSRCPAPAATADRTDEVPRSTHY
jgi:hypothetical protein